MEYYIDRKPIHVTSIYSGLNLDDFDNIYFLAIYKTDPFGVIKNYCQKINYELTFEDSWIFNVSQTLIIKYFFEYNAYKIKYKSHINSIHQRVNKRNFNISELELITILSNGHDIYNQSIDFKNYDGIIEDKKIYDTKLFELEMKYIEYKNNYNYIKQNPNIYKSFILAADFLKIFKPLNLID